MLKIKMSSKKGNVRQVFDLISADRMRVLADVIHSKGFKMELKVSIVNVEERIYVSVVGNQVMDNKSVVPCFYFSDVLEDKSDGIPK